MSRYRILPALWILLFGLVLRIIPAVNQYFWFDETFSLYASTHYQFPFYDYFDAPLHFVIVKLWSLVSYNSFWLRTSSIIFSLLSLWVYYKILHTFLSKRIAIIGLLLMTISPYHIHYAWQMRNYSLSLLIITISLYLYITIIQHIRKGGIVASKLFLLYFSVNFIGFLVHYVYGVFSFLLFFSLVTELVLSKNTHTWRSSPFRLFVLGHALYLLVYVILHPAAFNASAYAALAWIPIISAQSLYTQFYQLTNIFPNNVAVILLLYGCYLIRKRYAYLFRLLVIVIVGTFSIGFIFQLITSMSFITEKTVGFIYILLQIPIALVISTYALRTKQNILIVLCISLCCVYLLQSIIQGNRMNNYQPTYITSGYVQAVSYLKQQKVKTQNVLILPLYFTPTAWYYWGQYETNTDTAFPLNITYSKYLNQIGNGDTTPENFPLPAYVLKKNNFYISNPESQLYVRLMHRCNSEFINDDAEILRCQQ